MRVLQATAWYPPLHMGGTEVYVAGLVRGLRGHGVESVIAAPLAPAIADGSLYDGAVLRTFAVSEQASREELRGRRPHVGFADFESILASTRNAIYHQHSWTRGMGKWHLHAARAAGMRTVVTIHIPAPLCLNGTMMRADARPCSGATTPSMCAACWGEQRGASRLLARGLAALPSALGGAAEALMPTSRIATALSTSAIAHAHRADFTAMIEQADRIVVVCQWLHDAMIVNGVPREKLVLSRQGLDEAFLTGAREALREPALAQSSFRLTAVGRWHAAKGFDVLARAVCALPSDVALSLDIYGIATDDESRAALDEIADLTREEPRIRLHAPLERGALANVLARSDALAVPSIWLETGPLVVLEAKAMGVPVIGSRAGGIAELVREPDDGVLVAPGAVDAWRQTLMFAASGNLARRPPPQHIRTMDDVAGEMAELYGSLL